MKNNTTKMDVRFFMQKNLSGNWEVCFRGKGAPLDTKEVLAESASYEHAKFLYFDLQSICKEMGYNAMKGYLYELEKEGYPNYV